MPRTKLLSRKTLAAAALLAGVAVAPVARATTPTSTDEARGFPQLSKMKPMDVMHAMDKEGKGYVTREEFMKFQEEFFERMDRNHDGKVDTNEFMGKTGSGVAKQ
ncbi:EF-hand domain-containing protein [Anaeromyxobacter oryzae]|uniref:EF-hand domain-containing protein n=1 Tax=Anaeromyxobacter oryzae TaxID=2918170 RepID=A0ABM7X2Q9_9BACT|nr:EF-hand domain-containing protein [Anaeromyxobacter oryzae]BDG06080.1 hypothetical protein AMOR_50760 [Anaeromyxobacter oryzae]